jgi:hypothetical protein
MWLFDEKPTWNKQEEWVGLPHGGGMVDPLA